MSEEKKYKIFLRILYTSIAIISTNFSVLIMYSSNISICYSLVIFFKISLIRHFVITLILIYFSLFTLLTIAHLQHGHFNEIKFNFIDYLAILCLIADLNIKGRKG